MPIEIEVPGFDRLHLENVVLDYNGTLALDGKLIVGVAERLAALSHRLSVHVLTADTFGTVAAQLENAPCTLCVLAQEGQDKAKEDYVRRLGTTTTVAIGNGRNDRLMLSAAALGVAVVQGEGAAATAVQAADVIAPDILAALDLLLNPLRLVATLRS